MVQSVPSTRARWHLTGLDLPLAGMVNVVNNAANSVSLVVHVADGTFRWLFLDVAFVLAFFFAFVLLLDFALAGAAALLLGGIALCFVEI